MKYIVIDDNSRTLPAIIDTDALEGIEKPGDLVRMIADEGAGIVMLFEYGGISGYPDAYTAAQRLVRERRRRGDAREVRLVYGTWMQTGEEEKKYIALAPRRGTGMAPLYRLISDAYNNRVSGSPAIPLAAAAAAEEDIIRFRFTEESEFPEIPDVEALYNAIGRHRPFPEWKCYPESKDSDSEITALCYAAAEKKYGNPVPEPVRSRLDQELAAITGNGYTVIFEAARAVSDKAREENYPIGHRGMIGSSLAAYLTGITDIDPLPAHYVCPECAEYEEAPGYETPWELPDRTCPHCGRPMNKGGYNIPLETVFGYMMDREPAVYFNIGRSFMKQARAALEERFGAGRVIRGSSGQGGAHPGAYLILPEGSDIHDFTPVQKYRDPSGEEDYMTHLSVYDLDGVLLRIDLLSLDMMDKLRRLHQATGKDPAEIPAGEEAVIEMICRGDEEGIPEFSTSFAKMLIEKLRPHTAAELIRLDGMIHGTGVWSGNAEKLYQRGITDLMDMITCRDDIMNYLMKTGMDDYDAYHIMDRVRKGRSLTEEQVRLMRSSGVPDWYIWSCAQIRYLFPRSHAAEYTLNAIRAAWYKLHYPEEYSEIM